MMTDCEFEYEDIIDDLEGLERLKWSLINQKKKPSTNDYISSVGLVKDDNYIDENAEENAQLDRRIRRLEENMSRKRKVLSQQRYKLIISNNKEEKWNQNNQQQLNK